jgi:hypothetical protein
MQWQDLFISFPHLCKIIFYLPDIKLMVKVSDTFEDMDSNVIAAKELYY